jgi:hypothetical protein
MRNRLRTSIVTSVATLVLASFVLVGCGKSMSGRFANDMMEVEFKSGSKAYVTMGMAGINRTTTEVSYELNGDKIILHSQAGNLVLTRNKDGTLSGPMDELAGPLRPQSGRSKSANATDENPWRTTNENQIRRSNVMELGMLGMLMPVIAIAVLFFFGRIIASKIAGKGVGISGPLLVLQKFTVDESNPEGILIELEGRPSGLVGWLLTKMGVVPTTTLRLTGTEFHHQAVTFYGQSHEVTPLSKVTLTAGGHAKPFMTLLFGAIVAIATLLLGLKSFVGHEFQSGLLAIMFGLIVGGVCGLYYWFSESFYIAVMVPGHWIGAKFKRGVIGNEPVDLDKTLSAVGLIHRKTVDSHMPGMPA